MAALVFAGVRRCVPLLVVALLAGAAPGAAAPRAAAATGASEALVHTPVPMPGALVEAGTTEIRARLWSAEAAGTLSAEDVAVTLDGEAVAAYEVRSHAAGEGTDVHATVELEPGAHDVEVRFTDGAGNRAARSWSFTSTARGTRRFAGGDRVETAVALSSAAFPAGGRTGAGGSTGAPDAAVLARADDFADALAGVPLAAALGAPLLLSWRGSLPAATAAELRRVLPAGSTVHLLGGRAALSEEVRREVEALGLRAVRHGGPDRFATAAAVAALVPPSPGVILASGTSFPDALAASAPAARGGLPVLLTAAAQLPGATADALAARDASTVTVVGGTAVVGPDVEEHAGRLAGEVRRVSGPDRFATAVAVLDAFWEAPAAVSLASGVAFPDALAGARHAAGLDQPLLLTRPATLPAATGDALRRHQPDRLDVYGGPAAVTEPAARAAVRAAEDGAGAPQVSWTEPGDLRIVPWLETVTVELDRPVETDATTVYVEFGGVELRGTVEQAGPRTLAFRPLAGGPVPARDVPHPVRVVVRARDSDGRSGHHEAAFTYLEPDPVFATAGPVSLHLPARDVELIGFHEATHAGARQQQPLDTATPKSTLASRHRGNGSRTAADVVAAPDGEVLAPVTGRVVRAGSYVLYCDYRDEYVVIAPDSRPEWEVKVLHFHGLRVGVGDRVTAGETVVGDGPRLLPFRSQVDAHSQPRNWPHLHVEVVDPSIPTQPGPGC